MLIGNLQGQHLIENVKSTCNWHAFEFQTHNFSHIHLVFITSHNPLWCSVVYRRIITAASLWSFQTVVELSWTSLDFLLIWKTLPRKENKAHQVSLFRTCIRHRLAWIFVFSVYLFCSLNDDVLYLLLHYVRPNINQFLSM